MARFPRRARLLNPEAFQAVFKKGRRIPLRGLTAVVADNDVGHPRLGLAIARKSVRLATGRNRVKRIIREQFRRHQDQLVAVDLVFMARPEITQADADTVRGYLDALWQRLARQS